MFAKAAAFKQNLDAWSDTIPADAFDMAVPTVTLPPRVGLRLFVLAEGSRAGLASKMALLCPPPLHHDESRGWWQTVFAYSYAPVPTWCLYKKEVPQGRMNSDVCQMDAYGLPGKPYPPPSPPPKPSSPPTPCPDTASVAEADVNESFGSVPKPSYCP